MKKYIKDILPSFVIKFVIKFFSLYRNRFIKNFFSKNYDKRVLFSYITTPFRKESLAHSNYYEVTAAAKIFDELGYVVDVMHYEGKITDLSRYAVIYGFGDVFQQYFESGINKKISTIYYGAGMHVCHQNQSSLSRVKDVYQKKGVWLAKSARFVEKTWTHQTTLVDGIVALGNEQCAETYRKFYNGKVLSLAAPFFQTMDPNIILKERSYDANKSYLWFGSAGLIHKGLDLCLEFFSSRPELTLHVCGNIEAEKEFVQIYKHEIFVLPNIRVHGFVNIASESFKQILKDCSFVIFPSCSEGGSPSVLTTIGNGALIPIISKETSVATGFEIQIDELSVNGIKKAVDFSQSLTCNQIAEMQKKNLEFVLRYHNQDVYYANLKHAIKEILSHEM